MPEFPNKSTQFKPGQSGNPRGRPRGRSLASMLIEVLDEEAKLKDRRPGHGITKRELLIRELFDEAVRTKDAALLRLIFSYHDGKPPETPEDLAGEHQAATDPETARRVMRAASGPHGPSDPAEGPEP